MNKTLKTIAWICLALGLLGMAVDTGALVFGRRLVSERQAAFNELRSAAGSLYIAKDENKDGKPDDDCLQLQQPGWPGIRQPGFGIQQGRGGMMFNDRGGFNGAPFAGRGVFLLFFIALGPILLIVGAVILLVNREPKTVDAEKEEEEVKEVKKK
jgi:hypothetical protein